LKPAKESDEHDLTVYKYSTVTKVLKQQFFYELCPAPSLEGNTPYGPIAHGVPQVNPENDGPLWQFDLTCVGKPSGKTLWENAVGKIQWENSAGNSCVKTLWENSVGNPSGKTTHKGGGGAEIRTHS
jgi:hypothetical protein